MIVYPNAFILSLATGFPLKNPRIGWQTFGSALDYTAVSVSSESEDGPRDMPLRPDTAAYWKPVSLPATWQLEFGITRNIDYVGIAGHTLFSGLCTVKVETQLGTADWTLFALQVIPVDDAPLMFLDTLRSVDRMRITITGGLIIPVISSIYVGKVLEVQRSIRGVSTPMNMDRETALHRTLSRGGQFLGQDFRKLGVSGTVMFEALTDAWVRAYYEDFAKAARKTPFFFAWRPSDHPLDVAYIWAMEDITSPYTGVTNLRTSKFKARGIGNE